MSRIAARFDALAKASRTALVPYITAGDPYPEATVDFMQSLVAAGADVIELGIPFSDPMADGPTIQSACERALAAGTHLTGVLDIVARFRQHDADTPIVLMGYLNPIDRMGLERFCQRAAEAGVDGVLIVDMTAEEAPDIAPTLEAAGLDAVCLVAPTTGAERIDLIGRHARGFIYYVSFKGVTGAASLDVAALSDRIELLRSRSSLPVAVGFGVSTPEKAGQVARLADAVVVGSALVKIVADYDGDVAATANALGSALGEMRAAIDAEDEHGREARSA